MRKLVIGISAVFLLSCNQSQGQPHNQAQEVTHISAQTAFESYVLALNEGDVDAAADYYDTADGFHWIERGRVQYETGAEAAQSLRALQNGDGSSEMVLDNMRVSELTDDSALVSAQFNFTMRAKNGDPQFSFDGWMTVGMVKRDSGWKIAGGQTGPGPSE